MKNKKSRLQKKADKLLQELGRKVYKKCEVCGKPMSCLHHYWPKSTSSALRYDWNNLIPLCVGCHFQHHNGNPRIHQEVLKLRGWDWSLDLEHKRRQIIKTDEAYYHSVIMILEYGLDGVTKKTSRRRPL